MSISVSASMIKLLVDTDGPWLLVLSLELEFKGITALLLATGLRCTMLMWPIKFKCLTELSLAIGVMTKGLREEGYDDDDDDNDGPTVMVILSGQEKDREPVPMVDEALWSNRSRLVFFE